MTPEIKELQADTLHNEHMVDYWAKRLLIVEQLLENFISEAVEHLPMGPQERIAAMYDDYCDQINRLKTGKKDEFNNTGDTVGDFQSDGEGSDAQDEYTPTDLPPRY